MAVDADRLGVLDLQGGVQEHLDHLRRVGVAAQPVKRAAELEGLAGLIIPGGESTCLARLLNIFGLSDAISQAHSDGLKLWGTCAGAILLASDLTDEQLDARIRQLADIIQIGTGFAAGGSEEAEGPTTAH